MALGLGPDGFLYAGALIGDMLYRIDTVTGKPTEVAKFSGGEGVMDFAVNPKDSAMYATNETALYKLDLNTAALTKVADYSNVGAIMGIVFDKDGTLYATNYGFSSALFRIDLQTGRGQKISKIPARNVHSADIRPGGNDC